MKLPLIIVLNGTGGSGKDTFVDFCKKYSVYKIIHISTITPIKEAAKLLGWNGEKDEKSRKFLSDIKDLSTIAFDCSMKYIEKCIEEAYNNVIDYVFIDCREPKEIQKIVDTFSAKTVLINALKRVPLITSNHADEEVLNYAYDYIVDNNYSLKEFEQSAQVFIESFDRVIQNGTIN